MVLVLPFPAQQKQPFDRVLQKKEAKPGLLCSHLERTTGFGPATLGLGSRCSTTELCPHLRRILYRGDTPLARRILRSSAYSHSYGKPAIPSIKMFPCVHFFTLSIPAGNRRKKTGEIGLIQAYHNIVFRKVLLPLSLPLVIMFKKDYYMIKLLSWGNYPCGH